MYKHIIRPLLFLLNPESVHHLVLAAVLFTHKIPGVPWIFRKFFCLDHPNLKREVFGLSFKNSVGFAAGFDKDAKVYNEFSSFGFSFIEIGTVTPKPQPGNPKPRSFRLKKDKALINRMGFNNLGVEQAKERLKGRRANQIIGGNIGKNTATPNSDAPNDYLFCFKELYPFVDYFVVNISCPNITNLRDLQDKDGLSKILSVITDNRKLQNKYKPILLKVSPDLNEQQLNQTVEIASEYELDGFVATNTTVTRNNLKTSKEKVEQIANGGLSGQPLRDRSTEVIRFIHEKTQGKMPIIGVGGIMEPQDAIDKLNAGASLVQLYTGFIYSGPSLPRRINKLLLKQNK